MLVYNINSTESAKSQERCRYYRKKSGTHLDKQQHAPYYTYRDRHRKRVFTFDKYEGIPEGGGIDAHKSWIDLIYKVNNLLISLLLQYYSVPAYSLHNHEKKCVPL